MNLSLQKTVQRNCDISDARDNGVFSMCTLVLKLRNLFKWEHHIAPWAEPEPADLLDWIEKKERYWESIAAAPFLDLPLNNSEADPYDHAAVNGQLKDTNLVYGAGYGHSLKSVFFLAERREEKVVAGCRTIILGEERAKELASPFAMLQDATIYIRREPLRFYFWDQLQELQATCKAPLQHALRLYGIVTNGRLDRERLKERLDHIVDQEMCFFIYHEVGEAQEALFDSHTLKTIIAAFPDTPTEFVARALKDVLADTHPRGMISHIIAEQKETSLGFYVGFLDGLRRLLFPEIIEAANLFLADHDWQRIEDARQHCRKLCMQRAEILVSHSRRLATDPVDSVRAALEKELLLPLGLAPTH